MRISPLIVPPPPPDGRDPLAAMGYLLDEMAKAYDAGCRIFQAMRQHQEQEKLRQKSKRKPQRRKARRGK